MTPADALAGTQSQSLCVSHTLAYSVLKMDVCCLNKTHLIKIDLSSWQCQGENADNSPVYTFPNLCLL